MNTGNHYSGPYGNIPCDYEEAQIQQQEILREWYREPHSMPIPQPSKWRFTKTTQKNGEMLTCEIRKYSIYFFKLCKHIRT